MTPEDPHPHLAGHFREGRLTRGGIGLALELDALLSRLPWSLTGLDWEAMGPHGIAKLWDLEGGDGMAALMADSAFRDCPVAAALFSPSEPPLIGHPSFLLSHLDEIFWCRPGKRYVIGCTLDGAVAKPAVDAVAEYDGAETLLYMMWRSAVDGS